MFEEIVIESHRDLHKLLGVDGLLMEYFGYGAHVARELPCQPDIASALPVQFVFNQFPYVRHFFHFAFGEPRLVLKSTKRKKREPISFLNAYLKRRAPEMALWINKHEIIHAQRRKHFACLLSSTLNFPDLPL